MNDLFEKEEISEKRKQGINNVIGIDERRKIEKLVHAGINNTFIAELIGVHITSIGKELKRCEKGKYCAEKAQMDADSKNNKKNQNLTGHNDIEERIKVIEMQIEILFDKMKELDET
jgi:IS30 family transposase